jgi:hypothetical protein
MRAWFAVAAVSGVLLLGAPTAQPAPDSAGFFVGFSEDLPKWIGAEAVEPAQDLGASAFRITLQWTPGETRLSDADVVELERAVGAATGMKVVLSVYGVAGSNAPQSDEARGEYCGYVGNALARFPSVRDVVIWNEPNKSLFWRPQLSGDGASSAPVAYEALLARCYDVLHGTFAHLNVIGLALSPTGNDDAGSHSPGAFIRAVGQAYRASGRAQPLLDTVGHHAYGVTAGERPWRKHILSKVISQGDWNKLVYNLWLAFDGTAQAIPGMGGVGIWYMEGGSQTAIDAGKEAAYSGTENVAVIPDDAGGEPDWPPPGGNERGARPVHAVSRQHSPRGLPALRGGLLQLPAGGRVAACRLAVRALLGRPDAQGLAPCLPPGDLGGERGDGRLRRSQGRPPECGLHAALGPDRPGGDRLVGSASRRAHMESEQR